MAHYGEGLNPGLGVQWDVVGELNRRVGWQAKSSFLKNLPVPPAVQCWLERVKGRVSCPAV